MNLVAYLIGLYRNNIFQLFAQFWQKMAVFSTSKFGTSWTDSLCFLPLDDGQIPHLYWPLFGVLSFVWWTIIIWQPLNGYDVSESQAQKIFIPYLSGLLGIYWIKLHLPRKGTSCSSTVILSPGTKYLFKFLWHWSQKSLNGANWSHFFLAFLVFFSAKSDYG